MKNIDVSSLADVFVLIPKGFWIEEWAEECLPVLPGVADRRIISALVWCRNEIEKLESWGPFESRDFFIPAREIAYQTRIQPALVLAILFEQTEKGIWSCDDCRELDPIVSFIFSPRMLSPEPPLEE